MNKIFTKACHNMLALISDFTFPKIVLGLSGGPDSVFLLHVLAELKKQNKLDFVAAHLDHQWRKNSNDDVEFCRSICSDLNIPFISARALELDIKIKYNGSKEEIGRKLRIHFFKTIAKKENANFVAVAHHLDDQQETFFMRLIRGSSLSGLCCMKPKNKNFLRPLLEISKQEILQYLDSTNIKYLTDSTNISDDFLRNRIRNYIIPALKSCDTRFSQKFATTLKTLQQEEEFFTELTNEEFNKIFSSNNEKLIGQLDKFKQLNPVLQKRIIIKWLCSTLLPFSLSEGLLQEIIRFLISQNGGSHKISHIQITKKQNKFWIETN